MSFDILWYTVYNSLDVEWKATQIFKLPMQKNRERQVKNIEIIALMVTELNQVVYKKLDSLFHKISLSLV